ncbi:hypothetical protein SAMN04487962_1337 [Marinobacter segnicrescens]|uniref:CHAT domain-containing protein n=1 Tax=Marinobacter segnicrescens TaxID=430453 RepID=A0A1I0HQM9_9GAMM|nr:tetratricopeptide repeat protein [Marinobacter segnicrescens]SET86455.1 hypothetical protein SAMN04487962_1337 [Marinobacter segnicrescens]
MSGLDDSGKCPHCGHASEALSGQGIFTPVSEFDVGLLQALFIGGLDDFECDACHRLTGVRPTVIFIAECPLTCFFVVGTLAFPYQEDVIEDIRASSKTLSLNLEPQPLPDMDALRDLVRNHLRSNIDHLIDALKEPEEARIKSLVQIDARHFAAVRVALNVPQSGIHIHCRVDGRQLTGEASIDNLARCQASSWIALWYSRLGSGPTAPNLDDQLARRFYEAAVLPGAAEYALEMLAQIEQSELSLSFPAEYCLEALRASICALAETDNPSSGSWTMLFFKAEMTLRLGTDTDHEFVSPLILSEERARATVGYQDAGQAVANIVAGKVPPDEILDALAEIVAKLGYPQILTDLANTTYLRAAKPQNAADIAKILRAALDLGAKPEWLGTMLAQTTKGLTNARSIDELEWLAEEAIALVPNSPEVRAKVYAWLGSTLKTLRAPKRFLERISDTVQEWEFSLSPPHKAPLWTERSNALRMLGRFDEALAMIKAVLEIMHDERNKSDYCVACLNYAILLRETGAPDLSVIELEGLLSQATVEGSLRIGVLDSLAIAYHMMGRTADMVKCYERSLKLAVGPFSDRALASRVKLALSLVFDDRYDDAIDHLTELDPQIEADPTILFPAASAWLTIHSNIKDMPKRAFNRTALKAALLRTAKFAQEEGNIPDWLGALRLIAGFTELSGDRQMAVSIWGRIAQICREYNQSLSPIEVIRLARYAYLNNDNDLAHEWLLKLPETIASHAGQATDVAAVAMGLEPIIRRGLDEIASIAWDKAETFNDIRLIAEIRRNLVSRSQRYLQGNLSSLELTMLEDGISNEVLAALAPLSGRVGVLEWIAGRGRIACFVTVIDSAGEVYAQILEYPETDLAWLAEKMDTSLRAWHRERPGDPFDIPQWRELEAWLSRELTPHLKEGDHLVIFEHERFVGLPWHVAAAPYWSCSYAGGWASLLALPSVKTKPAKTSLGVGIVPVYGESDEVLNSFQQSLAHSKTLIEQLGLELFTREGKECDRQGLIELLAQADVCKLLCHGRVSLFGFEVDLMLAHEGALPSADPLTAASAVAQQHRFGWRDGRHLDASSRIIFSAACSTGLAHIVGVGERVSLLAGLNKAGTLSLVAPRWDAVATAVLPTLDEALRRHLGGMTLAAAVWTACREANVREPRWLAWTLCIEGDWR